MDKEIIEEFEIDNSHIINGWVSEFDYENNTKKVSFKDANNKTIQVFTTNIPDYIKTQTNG